ncbi:hypothetical protein [Streptococcus oricebi]|uniref:Uncharacterized protein n=1 Tax=Streptococcus oricebi TaxID=1547447 RepID=A0ABS5B8B4_9STRE|nr:hypothetical protein [Streptococcus oricebi]MBP2624289.1 hypothetical protein [Streptococcus oricebi]
MKILLELKSNYNKIRNRDFYFVTEGTNRVDIVYRRKFWGEIFLCCFILFLIAMIPVAIIFGSFGKNYINQDLLGFIFYPIIYLSLIVINCLLFTYLTSLLYYLIPVYVMCRLPNFQSDIAMFFFIVVVIYIIFTISLPMYSLRKVTNSTLIFGVLISILSSIVLERELRLESISFLILTSYTIGSFIINLKLKLGENIAKEVYLEILNGYESMSDEKRYEKLRDCIFYGGDECENRIISNPNFYRFLKLQEENRRKDVKQIKAWWTLDIDIISWMKDKLIYIVKRII